MISTLGDLARLVGGTVEGDEAIEIRGANPLADVVTGEITLVDSELRIGEFDAAPACAAVAPLGVTSQTKPVIAVAEVHRAFEIIVCFYRPSRSVLPPEIHRTAVISASAKLADDVTVGPRASIDEDVTIGRGTTVHAGVHIAAGCRIGQDVTIFPLAVLYEDTCVGDRSIIHSGAVLGAYGFGYRQENGRHVGCAQLGRVELHSDVEVGANTTIDRGTFGATIIGEGTKIDNQVQVAHNCRLGRHNIICSQVGIAGSATTGDYVVIAGQVGVRDHIHIGDQAVISAMAGLSTDVRPNAVMMGIPATPVREQKLKQAALAKLPAMRKEFKAMRQRIAELTSELPNREDAA